MERIIRTTTIYILVINMIIFGTSIRIVVATVTTLEGVNCEDRNLLSGRDAELESAY